MSNDILIFGKGYIGERIQKELNCNLTDKRISYLKDVEEAINFHQPKIIINCIGHTGKNNVDGCELDIDKTLFANAYIPLLLAEAALRHNIKLIHISSGCIYHYDYASQYQISENDIPNFMDLYYSRTKIYSELPLNLLSKYYNILTLRIRIPLDNIPNPRNILDKLIKYKNVIDMPNSVTYIPDFINALKHLIKIDAKGIYNIVNRNGLRYPVLLDIYKKFVPDFEYKIVELKSVLSTPRTNLIMSTLKLENSGFKVREINDVLDECVKEYLERKS